MGKKLMHKRTALVALITALFLLLCACSSRQSIDYAELVSARYSDSAKLSLTATLRTDFGDRVIDFTVNYTKNPDGSGNMRVISPELIAGIEAAIADDGVTLTYDTVALELGALPGTGLSPMETLPFMLRQWARGYVTQTGLDELAGKEVVRIVYTTDENGKALTVDALFDTETLAPVRSELYIDGTQVVLCTFG